MVFVQDVCSDPDRRLSTGLLQQNIHRHHRQPWGLSFVVFPPHENQIMFSFTNVRPRPVAVNYKFLSFFQGEQFELTPATSLLSQAVVLGDRRTFSVYDLTQPSTFGSMKTLNLQIRWKSTEGKSSNSRCLWGIESCCFFHKIVKVIVYSVVFIQSSIKQWGWRLKTQCLIGPQYVPYIGC